VGRGRDAPPPQQSLNPTPCHGTGRSSSSGPARAPPSAPLMDGWSRRRWCLPHRLCANRVFTKLSKSQSALNPAPRLCFPRFDMVICPGGLSSTSGGGLERGGGWPLHPLRKSPVPARTQPPPPGLCPHTISAATLTTQPNGHHTICHSILFSTHQMVEMVDSERVDGAFPAAAPPGGVRRPTAVGRQRSVAPSPPG